MAELENLAKYKAIIGNKIEENKKDSEKDELTTTIRNLRSEYNNNGRTLVSPDRILEANNQRLMKLLKEHEALQKNKKVIESLPTSRQRTYLTEKIQILERVQITMMAACVGAESGHGNL
jgi:septal ring factor EnvC (AmiA/AmiB activator)